MKIAQSAPLNRWYSCERNRPKSFVACFSLRYNYEQMISVKNRYSYALPDSPPPQPFPASLDKQLAFSHQPRTNVVDGLKLFALAWICLGNFYFLGYQPQMLPSIGKFICILKKHFQQQFWDFTRIGREKKVHPQAHCNLFVYLYANTFSTVQCSANYIIGWITLPRGQKRKETRGYFQSETEHVVKWPFFHLLQSTAS